MSCNHGFKSTCGECVAESTRRPPFEPVVIDLRYLPLPRANYVRVRGGRTP